MKSIKSVIVGTALLLTLVAPLSLAQSLGDSYTLWGIVFNEPQNCSDGICDEDDVKVNPVPPKTAVFYLGGLRVPPNGLAALGAYLAEDSSYGAMAPFPGQMLESSDDAEIHLVLKTHGGYVPGVADDQLTTFGEACTTRDCEDIQFAVFPPGGAGSDGVQHSNVYRFADFSSVPYAWATVFREEGGVRVAIHTNLKEESTTCGH